MTKRVDVTGELMQSLQQAADMMSGTLEPGRVWSALPPCPTKPGIVTVPHPRKDLPAGTLKSIARQSGTKLER